MPLNKETKSGVIGQFELVKHKFQNMTPPNVRLCGLAH